MNHFVAPQSTCNKETDIYHHYHYHVDIIIFHVKKIVLLWFIAFSALTLLAGHQE